MNVKNFVKLCKSANSALQLSVEEISQKFSAHSVVRMEYTENGQLERVVEVEFATHQGVFTFFFDVNDKCNFIILHPQNGVENIDEIAVFLNESYDYDYIKCCWQQDNRYIKIATLEEGTKFNFYCK